METYNKMKKIKESHQAGHYNGMDILGGEPIVIKLPTHVGVSLPLSDRGSYTMGDASVKEGEEPLDPDRDIENTPDPNDVFAHKVQRIITAAITDRQVPGSIKGHKDIVAAVASLIGKEKNYIKQLLAGKAADDPAMVKDKELINKDAATLKRMSGLIWPFN